MANSPLDEDEPPDLGNIRALQQRVRSLEDMLFSLAGADRYISPDLRSDRFNQARQGIILATEFVPQKETIKDALQWVAKKEKAEEESKRSRVVSIWTLATGVIGTILGGLGIHYLIPSK